MHPVMHALLVAVMAAAPVSDENEPAPAAPSEKSASTAEEPRQTLQGEFRAALLDAPWYRGLAVDVLGGFTGFPNNSNRARISMDRFAAVRVGYHRAFRFLTLGPELAWRSTNVVNAGVDPFWPEALLARLTGGTPQQVLRQENQAAAGLVLGARWEKLDYLLEGHLMMGNTFSLHTVMVTLERALPYNRSFAALGGYVGAGFMTGLKPIFLRMDVYGNYQVGPPPFGTQRSYLGYNLAAGVRW